MAAPVTMTTIDTCRIYKALSPSFHTHDRAYSLQHHEAVQLQRSKEAQGFCVYSLFLFNEQVNNTAKLRCSTRNGISKGDLGDAKSGAPTMLRGEGFLSNMTHSPATTKSVVVRRKTLHPDSFLRASNKKD